LVLAIPNFDKPFVVVTAASNGGVDSLCRKMDILFLIRVKI
jgi:hypothetical protein